MTSLRNKTAFILTNGRVVTPERVLDDHELFISGRTIVDVRKAGSPVPDGATVVDARGGFITPGFIDIHSDYIEHMAAPRPSSVMDFGMSLREAEKELVTHGITTMFHSLSIFQFSEFLPNPLRTPENTKKFADLIESTHSSRHLIRHRFHARFEIDNIARVDELSGYIDARQVHLVSFMDHTPGQGQYRDLEKYRTILKSYRNLNDEGIDEIIRQSQSREKITLEGLRRVADLARTRGIAVASHDDDTPEKVRLVHGIGVTVSEFPITMESAWEARRLGMFTTAGAPNVILGGSHAGNISATAAVLEGAVDILCSDYYPAALLHAVFFLIDRHGLDPAAVFKLVTANPARAVRMDDMIGSLEPGRRADVLVINRDSGKFPVITDAFVDGYPTLQFHYRE
jgi:alpha-D-ribose 1-methylphosphonate 5-triphosphate diphosphatase